MSGADNELLAPKSTSQVLHNQVWWIDREYEKVQKTVAEMMTFVSEDARQKVRDVLLQLEVVLGEEKAKLRAEASGSDLQENGPHLAM